MMITRETTCLIAIQNPRAPSAREGPQQRRSSLPCQACRPGEAGCSPTSGQLLLWTLWFAPAATAP